MPWQKNSRSSSSSYFDSCMLSFCLFFFLIMEIYTTFLGQRDEYSITRLHVACG